MVAELPHALGHLRTHRGNDACVSVSAQVLGGIETEGGCDTERSRAAPAPLGADGLGGIFDDRNAEFVCDPVECVHVGALAVKMNGKNGAKICRTLCADLPINQRRIEIQRAGIDVHENRRCAGPHNRAG